MELLLDTYHIALTEDISRNVWKNTVRKITRLYGGDDVFKSAANLSKTSVLLQFKTVICKESYFDTLPYSRAVLFFKARCRMLNFSNNFRGGSIAAQCGLCHNGLESDEHVFDECTELEGIRNALRISRVNVFRDDTTVEEKWAIAEFLATVQNRLRRL